MITADGQGYAPEPVPAVPTTPGPGYDPDPQDWAPAPPSRDQRGQSVREWRGGAPYAYGPSEPPDEPDERHEIDMDRAYQWERLALRCIGYALYLFGVIGYAVWAADWTSFGALVVGGLLPVAYLLGTESHERMIEADRKANMPERRGGDLPHLRRAEHRGYDDDPA
jgi:hypothetical protein